MYWAGNTCCLVVEIKESLELEESEQVGCSVPIGHVPAGSVLR